MEKNLTGKRDESSRLVAEGLLESFARFGRKGLRGDVVYFLGVIEHHVAEKANLLPVPAAPFADQQVETQPQPLWP